MNLFSGLQISKQSIKDLNRADLILYVLADCSCNRRQTDGERLEKDGLHLLRSTVVTLNTTPLSHRIMKSL